MCKQGRNINPFCHRLSLGWAALLLWSLQSFQDMVPHFVGRDQARHTTLHLPLSSHVLFVWALHTKWSRLLCKTVLSTWLFTIPPICVSSGNVIRSGPRTNRYTVKNVTTASMHLSVHLTWKSNYILLLLSSRGIKLVNLFELQDFSPTFSDRLSGGS